MLRNSSLRRVSGGGGGLKESEGLECKEPGGVRVWERLYGVLLSSKYKMRPELISVIETPLRLAQMLDLGKKSYNCCFLTVPNNPKSLWL